MASLDQKKIDWHIEILPRETKKAIDFLSRQKWLKKSAWYLAGGTALALQVGHRQSVDLDFFIDQKSFSPVTLLKHFKREQWVTEILKEGTIYGQLMGAKISFIAYPFFRAKETPHWFGSIRVLSSRDIAVMKIIAISQRGKKRDFIDLFWYVTHFESLLELLRLLPEQYPTVSHNHYQHILKSFMYFVDAEDDPMPKIFFKADWKSVKKYFQTEVPKIAKQLLD